MCTVHIVDSGHTRALLTVVTLCFGGLSASLTQTLVIPIQGELPELLHTTPANAGWVVTITLLAAAVTMPISGKLGDLFGKPVVLMSSAGMLAAGSVVCALSSTLAPMLVGRAMQGLAMGFIPVAIALIREVVPPDMANTGIAAMSATLGVGGAIGLPLAAWVVQTYDFHALFWMAAGFAVVLLVGLVTLVPRPRDARGGRVDLVGAVGLAIGLVGVLLGVSKGREWGWLDGRTIGSVVVGLVVLLVWGAFELGQDEPLVDLRATARRPVLLTNIAAVAIGFGMMAQAIVVPQLLQLPTSTGYGLGQTILEAGLWMAPGGLMMLVFAPVSSRMMTNVGPKLTLMTGAGVLGVGYLVAFLLMDAPWQLLVASIVISSGVGIGYAAMPALIMGSTEPSEAGSALGVNALMRSVGTTTAAAVMATILAGSGGRGGYELCFAIGAAAAFVGVAITALVPHVHQRAVRADATESATASA